MILDGHIHIHSNDVNQAALLERMAKAGVNGGILISRPPPTGYGRLVGSAPAAERIEAVLAWTQGAAALYPFFWIDPLAADADAQVAAAVAAGISGFKVICESFMPGEERALATYQAIADSGRPLLFHSGILWDGQVSSQFNRPLNFEVLLRVRGLRFALAHISWPWVDECIALYGKFLNTYSLQPELATEMFVDLTPGTPLIYREEALSKLFGVGYDVGRNLLFGSDCRADDYDAGWVEKWIVTDNAIYDRIAVDEQTRRHVFGGNLKRFLGLEDTDYKPKTIRPAE